MIVNAIAIIYSSMQIQVKKKFIFQFVSAEINLTIYLHLSIDVSTNDISWNNLNLSFSKIFLILLTLKSKFVFHVIFEHRRTGGRAFDHPLPIEIKQRHSISIPFVTQCRSFPRGFPFNTRKSSCADVDRAVTSSIEASFNARC